MYISESDDSIDIFYQEIDNLKLQNESSNPVKYNFIESKKMFEDKIMNNVFEIKNSKQTKVPISEFFQLKINEYKYYYIEGSNSRSFVFIL